MKTNIKNKGFTLIETLVAVSILMISIAGPLTIAQRSLKASIYAKDQVTASFLAQDMIEQIKRDKGTNGFDTWATTASTAYCSTGNCTLYIQGDGTYSNVTSATATKFTRVVDIDEIKAGVEYRVIVYVTWKSGSVSNQYKLESYIYNVTL